MTETTFARTRQQGLPIPQGRLTQAQLRLRVADNLRVNPATVKPSYYKVDGLDRVASAYQGKPVLTAQEVEDVVAWLATLK